MPSTTYLRQGSRGFHAAPYRILRQNLPNGTSFTLMHELTELTIRKEHHPDRRLFASAGLRQLQGILNTKAVLDGRGD